MSVRAESAPTATVGGRTDVAALAGLVTVTAWGSAFVGIRAAGDELSPGALALGRLLVCQHRARRGGARPARAVAAAA